MTLNSYASIFVVHEFLSTKIKRFQFIRKGLSTNLNLNFNQNFVIAVQEIVNKRNSHRSLILHSVPYPDEIINLPFIQWKRIQSSINTDQYLSDQGNKKCLKKEKKKKSNKYLN